MFVKKYVLLLNLFKEISDSDKGRLDDDAGRSSQCFIFCLFKFFY